MSVTSLNVSNQLMDHIGFHNMGKNKLMTEFSFLVELSILNELSYFKQCNVKL